MKYSSATAVLAAASASVALAQNSTSSGNGTDSYSTGLSAALSGLGLTTLTAALGAFPQIGQTLSQGGNYTVFAPTNDALAPLIAQGASALAGAESILMYHVSPSMLNISMIGNGTNHTIIPSALMQTLLHNKTSPLVLSNGMDGEPRIRTATQNVTVERNSTQYENLHIYVINEVLMTPANLTATIGDLNLTQLSGALSAVDSSLPATLDNTSDVTVFAPVNEAFAAISSVLPTLNGSMIQNVLFNHVINGSVVYSTEISENTTAISAAGEELRFMINGTDVYVMSGNATARIVRTDIPTTNGVMHLIENVLANTESDPEAARSAASSYAEQATASPSATAGVGSNAGSDKKGAASYSSVVAGSTLAAAVLGAAFALLA